MDNITKEDFIKSVAQLTGAKIKDLTLAVEDSEATSIDEITKALKEPIVEHNKQLHGQVTRKAFKKAERTIKEALPNVEFEANKLDGLLVEVKEHLRGTTAPATGESEPITLAKAIDNSEVKNYIAQKVAEAKTQGEEKARETYELDSFLISKFKEYNVNFPEGLEETGQLALLKEIKAKVSFQKGEDRQFQPKDKDGNLIVKDNNILGLEDIIRSNGLYSIGTPQSETTPASKTPPVPKAGGNPSSFGYTDEEVKNLKADDYYAAKEAGHLEKAQYIMDNIGLT